MAEHASHKREEVQQLVVVPHTIDVTRAVFWEVLHCKPDEFNASANDLLVATDLASNLSKRFCEYANSISQKVFVTLADGARLLLRRIHLSLTLIFFSLEIARHL